MLKVVVVVVVVRPLEALALVLLPSDTTSPSFTLLFPAGALVYYCTAGLELGQST